MTRTHLLAALAVASLALAPRAALAQERASQLASPTQPRIGSARPGFALDVSVMTLLPLVVGGTVALEVPGHVVLRVGAGIVPSSYVDAVSEVGIASGAFDAQTAQTLGVLLDDATFLEFGLGLRPWGTPGLELDVSYDLIWSHHRLDMADLGGSAHEAGLDLTVDAVHVELAWQTEPVDHVYLRIAAGWAHAFDHGVAIAGQGDDAVQEAFRGTADALATVVGRSAFGPTLGVSLGARI